MKHLITFLSLVAFFAAGLNAQTTSTLSAIQFVDANTVFASGAGGTVLRSDDGGNTWTSLASSSADYLVGLSFSSATTGTIVGGNPLINTQSVIRTDNLGATWFPQTTGSTVMLLGVSFPNANTGWAVGSGGKIFKTTDGGTTWATQTSGVTENLEDAEFVDANTGYIAGDWGRILKTTNGGAAWVAQTSGTNIFLYGISFVNASTGTIVGNAGKILRTTNGGATWASQTSGTTTNLTAVWCVDANIQYAVGWSGIIRKTTNAGTTWTAQTSGTTSDLYGVSFKDANTGIAVGLNGKILRTTDGGTTWSPPSPLPIQLASFTATVLNASTVRLDWRTLSELNNYGFEVQKAFNGENNYQTIPGSFIPGHGTTTEPQSYTYRDLSASEGIWFYRLKQIDLDGTVHYSDGVRVDILTSVAEAEIPGRFFLHQNYPNPFNPETHISFELPSSAFVTLKIYTILGQEAATLMSEPLPAGMHTLDVASERFKLTSGVYLYRLEAGSFAQTRRMVVLK
jgi:photosystem II stability/assembly factor-like uncharacterized protein